MAAALHAARAERREDSAPRPRGRWSLLGAREELRATAMLHFVVGLAAALFQSTFPTWALHGGGLDARTLGALYAVGGGAALALCMFGGGWLGRLHPLQWVRGSLLVASVLILSLPGWGR